MSLKKWRSPIFEKKMGKMVPNLLEFESLDLSDFAYYDRQAWYLAGTGGPVAEKFSGPNNLSDIAHSDCSQW